MSRLQNRTFIPGWCFANTEEGRMRCGRYEDERERHWIPDLAGNDGGRKGKKKKEAGTLTGITVQAAPAGVAAPRSRNFFGGEDCLSEASSAAQTIGTGAKAPSWGHARARMVLGPFACVKRIANRRSSCVFQEIEACSLPLDCHRLPPPANRPGDSPPHDGAFLLDEENLTGDSIMSVVESPVFRKGSCARRS